jgi:tungstate transport system substrate-binding protein
VAPARPAAAAIILAAVVAAAAWWFIQGNSPVRIQVTTTTSLYATGLLDKLATAFQEQHPNVRIEFIAVGSGEALRRAAAGDACMVFVHAPSLEKKYIDSGVLERHRFIAYNYFAIVGPESDPAGVKEAGSAAEAFQRIYRAGEEGKTRFISRGDNSGTHVRELMIWRLAGLDPRGRPWYIESGQGMAKTLIMADEMSAYTLSDTGTYLKLAKEGRIPDLGILYTNSSELINIYSVYIVRTCSGDARRYAELFEDFVAGPEGQKLIENHGVREYGAYLFYPARGREGYLEKAWQLLAEG